MTHETKLDLSAGGNETGVIALKIENGMDADSVSIQARASGAWGGGVITVRKANSANMDPVDINGTPVTITADGMKELAKADWQKAEYLVLVVTTASSGITVDLAISTKRLGGGGPT